MTEPCVAVPIRLLQMLMHPKLDALHPDERVVVRAQNPAEWHFWTKSVSPMIRAGDLQELVNCLLKEKIE